MNWVIGKKQKKRRNRIKAQFGKNPMELEAWESLEKRMREIRMYEELVVQDVKKEEWQSAGSVSKVLVALPNTAAYPSAAQTIGGSPVRLQSVCMKSWWCRT